ncbi:hypothetical protein ACE41H_21565 [Paenibacillus enshidis]|uniref:Uncharacterized protein n=1 Tax=Paenibacillus enshidis TaxID=1458439 RepID=A0ABV5B1Q8_9BACL
MSEGSGKRGPKAYKVFDHVKEKVEDLFKQSGIEYEGDFLEHMASIYEMQQLKSGVGAGYQKQISTLEYHTKSVVDMFVSLIQTEAADRLQIAEDYEGKLGDRAAEIMAQQDEITRLNQALLGATEIINKQEKEIAETRQLVEALQKSSSKDEQILTENKERIERLSKMLSDTTNRVNQAVALEQRFTELTELTERQAREIAEAEAVYEERLQNAAERAEIAQEKALAAAERKHTAEIRALLDEASELRKQLHAQHLLTAEQRQQIEAQKPKAERGKPKGEEQGDTK